MLNDKKLPNNNFAEAAYIVVYILAISLTKAVRNITPYKA